MPRVCRILILLLAFALTCDRGAAAGRVRPDSPPAPTHRTLIQNAALVITMEPSLGEGPLGIIEHADVLIAGDTLAAIGQKLSAAGAQRLDASGKIVLPGFVDVHNHLWQSVIRGCGSDKDLFGWLEECVFPMRDGVIGERDAYAAVRLNSLDLISTGVTTVLDWSHSFTPAFVAGNLRALRDSGLRFVYAYFVRDQSIAEFRRVQRELTHARPPALLQMASHPSMALLDRLTHAAKLARLLEVPLNVHLNENIKQRAEEPFQAMAAAGAFGVKLVGEPRHPSNRSRDRASGGTRRRGDA